MRRLFLLVAATVLVDTMFYAAIAPLLPTYEAELGLSKTAAGVLTASYPAGTLLGALPSGWLAGRVGAKRTMAVGLALLTGASLVFAFGNSIEVLDSARFLQGVGGACSWAGGLAWLISESSGDRRGELIGSALGAAIFGVLLGPVLGGAATETSPELVFSLVAATAAVLFVLACLTPAGPREEQATWRDLWRALQQRTVLLAVWLFVLPALFTGVFDVLVPLRLDDLGTSGLVIGGVFLLAAAVEGVMSPLTGRISDRRGRLLPLRVGLAAAGVSAILLPLPGTAVVLVLAVLLAVGSIGCFWAPAGAMLSEASESAGLDQGFAFGLMNLAWAAGQTVGGAAGGGLAEATTDAVPYAILAVLFLFSLVLVRPRALALS